VNGLNDDDGSTDLHANSKDDPDQNSIVVLTKTNQIRQNEICGESEKKYNVVDEGRGDRERRNHLY